MPLHHHTPDRRQLIAIALLLLSVVLVLWWSVRTEPSAEATAPANPPSSAPNIPAQPYAAPPSAPSRPLTPFAFDPNTADSATLVRLGLPAVCVRSMLSYRRSGGTWRSAEHFRRLYGLTDDHYRTLLPYIRLSSSPPSAPPSPSAAMASEYVPRPKYADGTVLDLNAADTTELQAVPGIGSYYARRITAYRERLGGYVSVEQLLEIPQLPPELLNWFEVRPTSIRLLPLNTADFSTLLRHPYLSEAQVKSLLTYRRTYGRVKSLAHLHSLPHFTEADLRRLSPYVSWE